MTRRAALVLAAASALLVGAAAGPAAIAVETATPLGGSALDEVFPDGLPFPFERVIERLRSVADPDAVRTALIPLGRSLQRYSAAPDYFSSPRIVVAITRDGARGPDMPRLGDRLFIGYAPAAAVVEAISYDEVAGRFEFQEIVGYGLDPEWRTEAADRAICLRCHQGGGPIFARPLWSETNANPAVAARLDHLGSSFHGLSVRQSVDELDAFDAATDRAARIALANRLWTDGCSDPTCRAALLIAALRFGLNGARADWRAGETAGAAFKDRTAARWPEGLAVISPDLPNRDPMALLASTDPESVLETTGAMNPEAPREPMVLWRPGAAAFDDAAREIAAMLAPGDYDWLDALLRGRMEPEQTLSVECALELAPAGGVIETRFSCGGGKTRVQGLFREDGAARIDRLTIAGQEAPARIGARDVPEGAARRIEVMAASLRLPDGSRIGPLALEGTMLRIDVVDDLSPLAAALKQRARESAAAFGPGPFPRRAVLALIAEILGGENG